MTIRGILLDFYGTVVEEDDEVIAAVISRIALAHPDLDSAGFASSWGAGYFAATGGSFGAGFLTQRSIAVQTLSAVLADAGASGDAAELCAPQFDYWRRPRLRTGSAEFVAGRAVPVVIVSNIDREDLEPALDHVGIEVDGVVTSDDVRAYKPRPEMFRRALDLLGLAPAEVLHVGDSLTADVGGASSLGIPVAWIRRGRRARPEGVEVAYEAEDLGDLSRQLLPE